MKHLVFLFLFFLTLQIYATEELSQFEFDQRYGQTLQTSDVLQDAFKDIDFLFAYNNNLCGPTAFVNVMKKLRTVLNLDYYKSFEFESPEDELAYLVSTYIPTHGIDFTPSTGVTSAVLRSMIIAYLNDLQKDNKFQFEVIRQDFLPMFPQPHELRGISLNELSQTTQDKVAVLLLMRSFNAKSPTDLISWEQYNSGHWVVVGGYNKKAPNEILLIDSGNKNQKVVHFVLDNIEIPKFHWASNAPTFRIRQYEKDYSEYKTLNLVLAAITIRIK